MFTLIEERKVKAARKSHRCIWCGEAIRTGDSYTYERSIFNGELQSNHWHDECLEYMLELAAEEGGEIKFTAHDQERPEHTSDVAGQARRD